MDSEKEKTYLQIKEWAEEDRPREKLLLKGTQALSDAELIAILIGSGTVSMSAVELAKHILQKVNNNLNDLAKMNIKSLKQFKGIGEAKAISIVSALELGRRRKEQEPQKRIQIRSSQQVYDLMQPHLLDLAHEEFWIIMLSRAGNVLAKERISSGGLTATVVDPRMIFKRALEEPANAIIAVHNHPSGNRQASKADLVLTDRIKEGGKILEIPLLDHLIFTNQGYFSFQDEGLL